jgi:hypothetical protein
VVALAAQREHRDHLGRHAAGRAIAARPPSSAATRSSITATVGLDKRE